MKITKKELKSMVNDILNEQAPEKERIVDQIIEKLKSVNIISRDEKTRGLISMVDNYDEFEDLMRYVIDAVGLPNENNQLYIVLKRIAEDFRENPDDAADLSVFNIGQ